MLMFETKQKMPKFGLCLQLDRKEESLCYLEIRKETFGISMYFFYFSYFCLYFEIDT
jgi:hypothetical protein